MTFTNQQMINQALAYWSDNTVSLADFTGIYGFKKLLHQAVLYITYIRERDNRKTQMIITLSDAAKNKSFNFEQPQNYDPATGGNMHVWDLLRAADPNEETGWRTINAVDYGRLEIKAVIPLVIVPKTIKKDDKTAISSVLSIPEIMQHQTFGVYSKIHNNILIRMSPGELFQMEENQKDISWLQSLEEKLRLEEKKEIDKKLEEHWKKKEEEENKKIDDLKLENVQENDLSESYQQQNNLQLNNIQQQDVNSMAVKPQKENVMDEFKNGQNRSIRR